MGGCVSKQNDFQDIEPIRNDYNYYNWIDWQKTLQAANSEHLKRQLPHSLGRKLKKVIGPYGLQIIDNFQFQKTHDKENFYVLLRKLDIFFYLRLYPRMYPSESIIEYRNRLLPIATNYRVKFPDDAVKEKITFELKTDHFVNQINKLVFIHNDILDIKILSMDEIIFLVNIYDNYEARARREDFLKKLDNKNFSQVYNENCCGRQHSKNRICAARGQRCWKCNGLNHFAKTCKKYYIRDCLNCGINHVENKCGAFVKQCSRCKRFNHFYWKCFSNMHMVTYCQYCGVSHVNIRRKCSAYEKTCFNCGRIGHLSIMYRSRRRR